MIRFYIGIMLTLPTVTACAAEWHPAPLYPALEWRPAAKRPKAGKPCLPAPPAVRNISTVSKYGEGNQTKSSVVDEDSEQQYLADTAPIRAFANEIANRSDHFIEGRPSGNSDAACALDWMDAWAQGGAFLGEANRQGEAVRKWELATFATTYIKIAEAPSLDKAKLQKVSAWIHAVGAAAKADYSRDLRRSSRRNNHMYWAAWAVTAAGIATGDREFFDWGIAAFPNALDEISDDGSLPLELERRTRAASYHMFALQPLIMLAEAGEANGIAMYSMKNYRLQKLIDLNLASLDDLSVIGRLNGFTQENLYSESVLSWMEPYYARFHDPRVVPWLEKYRPFGSRRVGGDMTALYVRPMKVAN